MKVEREAAGLALPFTAGVLLAAYSGYGIHNILGLSPIGAMLIISTLC